jgi:putative endonuclease
MQSAPRRDIPNDCNMLLQTQASRLSDTAIMPRPHPLLSLMERALALVERRHPPPNATAQQGQRGERAAYFFLRKQGYTVVARRWRHALLDGEIDLIAWEGDTLCMVEVKTRGSRTPFAAEFSIDKGKAAATRRMADAYVRQLPFLAGETPTIAVRFDAVSVYFGDDGKPDTRLQRDFFR